MKKDIEKLFKEALEGYEKPYDAAAWSAIKGKLPKSSGLSNTLWIGAASVAAITIAGFLYSNYTTEPTASTKELKTEKVQATALPTATEKLTSIGKVPAQHIKTPPVSSGSSISESHKVAPDNINSTNILNTQAPNEPESPSNQEQVHSSSSEEVNPTSTPQEAFVAPQILTGSVHVCPGEAVALRAENVKNGYTIQWISSEFGTVAQKANASFKAEETTQITAQVTDNKGIRHNVGGFTVYVDAVTVPRIQVEQGQKYTKPYFTLSASNLKDEKLNWSMDYQQGTEKDFAFYLTQKGTYPVHLRVTNEKGCSQTVQQKVELTEDYNLFAENAFTPSESTNNTFIPKALMVRDVNFKMTVLDRGGNVVYETKDKTAPWTGRTNSGEYAKPGAYLWVVTLINEEGAPEKYTGEIVLLQ